ncbi:MAG: hypothetical protein U5K84_06355 [Alkalibacterium sp.]|nr:hypothetical protein [Alkalibacterium sp.]
MEQAIKDRTTSEPLLIINGGQPLEREVGIDGAKKNAALPAIVASCLSDETVELKKCTD